MVYVTGDLHGSFAQLKARVKKLKKQDVLLVCGDFGFLWEGGEKEEKQLERLAKKNVLFLDGTHENFAALAQYPVEPFFGGRAQKLGENLYHLLRGECYTFGDATVFTFGGGETDVDAALEGEQALSAAQPAREEFERGVETLAERERTVDYIVTHEAPAIIRDTLLDSRGGAVNEYLAEIMKRCKFRAWYFGCYHIDRALASTYYALYHSVLPLAGTERFLLPGQEKKVKHAPTPDQKPKKKRKEKEKESEDDYCCQTENRTETD